MRTISPFSLDNLERDFGRDGDVSLVANFVQGLIASQEPLPSWPEAAAGIRFSAELSDHQFGDVLVELISHDLCRVLVYTDPEERRLSWLTPARLTQWGVTADIVAAAAAQNMDALLAQTDLEVHDMQDSRLGIFSTSSVFKASLVFSPGLKTSVAEALGWPIHAVIPCRDFLYMFHDPELIPLLGSVVLREYNSSGYSITTEVFRISDSGIEAVGNFGA